MLGDIQAFIAALQAHDWLSALTLAIKISNEILALLAQQGLQPHVAKMQAPATALTIEDCCKQLEAETSAAAINWGNVLAIVQALLKLLLPVVVTP